MDKVILAVDAGGTSIKYRLLREEDYAFLTEQKFYDMPSGGTKRELLNVFENMFADAAGQCEKLGSEIIRVAFSVPGPFDCATGISRMEHKWKPLKDMPLKEAFRETGILPRTAEFIFLHDVHAFLAGEKRFGYAKNYGNTLAVIIGTGLGVGLWENGRLRFSKEGGPLYSIYHRLYKEGVLEDYVSGRGISIAYEHINGQYLDARKIADKAREGDHAAQAVYQQMGTVLGESITDIIMRHDIQCVVIGGRVSLAFDLFGQALGDAAGKCIRLYASEMLESAAMLGAAVWQDNVLTRR